MLTFFICGTQLNIWPCKSVCLSQILSHFFYFIKEVIDVDELDEGNISAAEENKTNNRRLSWAVPHSDLTNTNTYTATDTMNTEPNIEPNMKRNIKPNIEPKIEPNIETHYWTKYWT